MAVGEGRDPWEEIPLVSSAVETVMPPAVLQRGSHAVAAAGYLCFCHLGAL